MGPLVKDKERARLWRRWIEEIDNFAAPVVFAAAAALTDQTLAVVVVDDDGDVVDAAAASSLPFCWFSLMSFLMRF